VDVAALWVAATSAVTYLSGGAYGMFGSSTIAYGPADHNGQADVLCQEFLKSLLAGASLGRSVLEARQRYVAQVSTLGPHDLKTLAQFSLMGDPSVQCVDEEVGERPLTKGMLATWRRTGAAAATARRPLRRDRRASLLAKGEALRLASSFADSPVARDSTIDTQLGRLASQFRMRPGSTVSLEVHHSSLAKNLPSDRPEYAATAIHVLTSRLSAKAAPGPQLRALVAYEWHGQLMSIEELFSK
jgi:Peptidase family C25